ncbi:MAG: ATP-dependent metallopeptidase FtsH/Yme1/Tma family protein, partial [Clostridiales bacterium]|nr:ATP-dependent metallopeptidase FtsH/Yme1/Tma family protein [Clostridiales bacterium]
MKRVLRSIVPYIIVIIIIMLIFRVMEGGSASTVTYSYSEFQAAVESGEVESITISQNEEVPTGTLTLYLEDGSKATLAVSDVGSVESYLSKENFTDYILQDVPGESVWVSVLPSIIMVIVVIFLIVMMTGQANAGTGGNKMMNFGKSRAKMTTAENVDKGFDDVAGLAEEKEELEGLVDFL